MALDAFQRRRERQLLKLLLPALIPLTVLIIYPALYSIYLSMTNEALTGVAAARPRFVGAANYFRLFSDLRFWNSLVVTFIFVVGSAIIGQFVIGFIAAVALRRKVVGSSIFGAAILLPNAAPEVVAGFMWISMLAGGDHATLIRSIKEKLYPLGDDVVCLPGHGQPCQTNLAALVEQHQVGLQVVMRDAGLVGEGQALQHLQHLRHQVGRGQALAAQHACHQGCGRLGTALDHHGDFAAGVTNGRARYRRCPSASRPHRRQRSRDVRPDRIA